MDSYIRKYALIVAGGTGSRLGGDIPKQFRLIDRRPVVWWSMNAFHEADTSTRIILVIHPDYLEMWKDLFHSLPEGERFTHEIALGGRTRTESVVNGLRLVDDSEKALVAVHDAARPLVTASIIAAGWEAGLEYGAAVPVVPVTDSIRRITDGGSVAVDRSEYVAVQTPQVFDAALLKNSYALCRGMIFSDDAAAVEAAGHHIGLYEGSPLNMKVTNPGDMEMAADRLRTRE